MKKRMHGVWACRAFRCLIAAMGGWAMLGGVGCVPIEPPAGDDGGDGGDGGTAGRPGPVTAEIVSPATSFGVSVLDPPLSVLYTIEGSATAVQGYFVPVQGAGAGSPTIGERKIVANNLPLGANRSFSFDPQDAGLGFFRVGIAYQEDGEAKSEESTAVIQVQGGPNPRFILPIDPVTDAVQGSDVLVTFDAGDPENAVQWRLFILSASDPTDNPPHQLGTELARGSGNVGTFTLGTDGLAPGEYQLGVSATDSGSSVSVTGGRGEFERIVTIPRGSIPAPRIRVLTDEGVQPPTLAFTAPAATNVELFGDDLFVIKFKGEVFEEGTDGAIEIFFDNDSNVANGFTSIARDLPVTTTSFDFRFPANMPEGTYSIGGTIRDGINASRTVYAQGRLQLVRNVTLTVNRPNSSLPVPPGTLVTVDWTTNAPGTSGASPAVEVFTQRIVTGGSPPPRERVFSSNNIAVRSTSFTSDVPGLFRVTVELHLKNGSTIASNSPSSARFSSLPGILWLGSLATDACVNALPGCPFEGAIFGGVNFEDNAGSSLSTAGDLDGDGFDEFIVNSRYGKPFFTNPNGIGNGEAFVIYGRPRSSKLRGTFNLNSVGTSRLRGVTLVGIRTAQGNVETDGMSQVGSIPDVDGDGKNELVFGFPDTKSRGHNISPLQDGNTDPRAMATLERENQFLRGGIVIVSSTNSILNNPIVGRSTIHLDVVGQDFDETCVRPDPTIDDGVENFTRDIHADFRSDQNPCVGTCLEPRGGGEIDATNLDFGFVSALARDYFWTYVYSVQQFGGVDFNCGEEVLDFIENRCSIPVPFTPDPEDPDAPPPWSPHEYCELLVDVCEPFTPGLHNFVGEDESIGTPEEPKLPQFTRRSGFYPEFYPDPADPNGDPIENQAREPIGARVIGVGLDDKFGTTFTVSNAGGGGLGDLIVSAPGRTARGILVQAGPGQSAPEFGGEILGMADRVNENSGVAYIFKIRSLWTDDEQGRIPPKPHQYIVGEASSCGHTHELIENVHALRIAGLGGDQIINIVSIDDFNNDSRGDFAIGAPKAMGSGGSPNWGKVYIAFRRDPEIEGREGGYVLEKLALPPGDDERLDGMVIVANGQSQLGASLATGFDFNQDGISDLVVGAPAADGGTGEVLIIFGDTGLVTPEGGISVNTLLNNTRTSLGRPVAARIRGNTIDGEKGQFGFNLANVGDLNDDGIDDLLISAPMATPRFDPDPSDEVDELTAKGVDLDGDGVQDDIPFTANDDLNQAGLVYVIFGDNRLDQIKSCSVSRAPCDSTSDCNSGETCALHDVTININQLGTKRLQGFMIAGRFSGDQIGGGDAGAVNANKAGRGRSIGLAAAGDVDGDGRGDVLIGSILADPRRDPNTGIGVSNGGEVYLLYGSSLP